MSKRKRDGLTVTDMFCGAGGTSQGAADAGLEVVWAMNHWQLAVNTHATNFPSTNHDCVDLHVTTPRRYDSTDILLASPECTWHSLAGGRRPLRAQGELFNPRQADPAAERSRATMWDVPNFAEWHDYNLIIVENVPDARHWPMWDAWIHAMKCLRYDHEVVYFNSMFAHPTPQSRDRMYVVFWKEGNPRPNLDFRPRAYCSKCDNDVNSVQSWKNPTKRWGKYRQQYIYCCPQCGQQVEPYYYCAWNCIDWSLPSERIGDREKPLAEKTVRRIEAGLRKFAGLPWPAAFLEEFWGTGGLRSISEAMSTVVGVGHHALVQPFMTQLRFDNEARSLDEPLATLTTGDNQYLCQPQPFLFQSRYDGERRVKPVTAPLQTVTASGDCYYLVQPFLTSYYGQGEGVHPVEDPLGTVTVLDRHALVIPPFLSGYYGGDSHNTGLDQALPTITASTERQALIMPFVTDFQQGDNRNHLTAEPLSTVTSGYTSGQAVITPPFLTDFHHAGSQRLLTEASGTVTTGMVAPFALIQPTTEIGVADCYFRMLQPGEIKDAMAFRDSYVVLGNKSEKIKQLGNAVTPPVMRMLLERCIETLQ